MTLADPPYEVINITFFGEPFPYLGHYAIKPANSNQQKLVYCDMQSDTYDDVNETEELVWSPIGTILPWVPKLDSSGEILPLPHGWVFCNGSSITEGNKIVLLYTYEEILLHLY